jgi:hypothetical protein
LGVEGADRAAETAAAVLAILVYVLVVSRGEVLPYDGMARSTSAPLLALVAAGLVGWRLRRAIGPLVRSRALWRWAPLGLAVALAAVVRVGLGDLGRPVAPGELEVLTRALLLLRGQPVPAAEPGTLLLAGLHAPVAAARFMAGVSAGLWQEIAAVTPVAGLPWSRAVHLAMSLLAVVGAGVAAGRLGGPPAGWLAAGLLAISSAALAAAAAVDLAAPAGLLVALLILVASGPLLGRWSAVRPPRRLRPVALGLGIAGLVLLWLPGLAAAAAAPAVAVVVALLGMVGLRPGAGRTDH